MFWKQSYGRCVLLPALAALLLSNALATSVIAPPFEMLVSRAELIFTGQVVSQHSDWRNDNGQKSIVTLVSFSVQQVHKGTAGANVTLQFLGGTVGDVTFDVAEIPKFKPGERVVLFVEGNGVNASPVVGFFHGKFSLQRDRTGRETVLKYNGEPFSAFSSAGRAKQVLAAASRSEPMTLGEFTAEIRRHVTGARK